MGNASPKRCPLAWEAPGSPTQPAEPPPPATILRTCSCRNSGGERGAPPTWGHQSRTTCRVTRPSRKEQKKKRERAQGGRKGKTRAVREPRLLTRAHMPAGA